MIDLEKIIERFIAISIKSIKARDDAYVAEFILNEFSKNDKYITKNKTIKELYHKYLFGDDIISLLNTDKFYNELSKKEYPLLFESIKIETKTSKKKSNNINWEQFEMPINQKIIVERIPMFRKEMIKLFKKYVAYMELKKWIAKNGITSPPSISNFKGKSKIYPKTFNDIFTTKEWSVYIDALYKVEKPVIDKNYNYIGKVKKHKGVIASWIKHLQTKGIIDIKYSRQELSRVLNNEINGLDIGLDGKTIDNLSKEYEDNYREKLIKLTK